MKLGKSMQKPKKDSNQVNANLSTSNCDAERTMTDTVDIKELKIFLLKVLIKRRRLMHRGKTMK